MQGGVGDCTNETARALVALGVGVGVLTSIRAARNSATQDTSLTTFPTVAHWDWSSLHAISQAIRSFNADIVHIQYQTAAFGMHPAINFLPRSLALWDHWPRSIAERG